MLSRLGEETSTNVFVAKDLMTDRTVVVKYSENSLEQEYDILTQFNHDRIINCIQYTGKAVL